MTVGYSTKRFQFSSRDREWARQVDRLSDPCKIVGKVQAGAVNLLLSGTLRIALRLIAPKIQNDLPDSWEELGWLIEEVKSS